MLDKIPYLEQTMALPHNNEGEPIFQEPWEARALVMALALFQQDADNLEQFRRYMAEEMQEHGESDAESYYQLWLESIERLLIERGIFTETELTAKTEDLAAVTLAASKSPA